MKKIKKDKTIEKLIKIGLASKDGAFESLDNTEIIKVLFNEIINKNSKFKGLFNNEISKIKNEILKSINIWIVAYSEIEKYYIENEDISSQIQTKTDLTTTYKDKCWKIWKDHTNSKSAFDKWFNKKGRKTSIKSMHLNENDTAETFIDYKQKRLNNNIKISFTENEQNELKSLYTLYKNAQIEIDSLKIQIDSNSNNIKKCLKKINVCSEEISKSLNSFEKSIWNKAIDKYDAELSKEKNKINFKLRK